MPDTQDNFKALPSNFVSLSSKRASLTTVPIQNRGIMESEMLSEENIMSQDTYSKSEIDLKLDKINSDTQHGFEKIDLKIDQLKQEMRSGFEKIDLKFEKVDLKFDNFEKRVETMLLTQENKRLEEQAKSKKEFMYWFIGLLVSTLLGILAIIVTILTTK
ncbi:hypothetical protein QP439_04940 [Streptococcus sp. UMB1203]|uniref:hypothetical protein n=1 Tax=Streptococcus sp. UMB1203 TaxID=3046327 RepID=UPI00255660E0|nr:hypothetical protein [Streptococcus sp. UMB1203]MDK7203660.1 hypothetical protein [Streptococcus sp. UMB1203]